MTDPEHNDKPELEPEPADLAQKRLNLLFRLEKEIEGASDELLKQAFDKMHELVASTEPGARYKPTLYREVTSAFQAYADATKALNPPPEFPAILEEANDFMLASAESVSSRLERAGVEVSAEVRAEIAASLATLRLAKLMKDEVVRVPSPNLTALGNTDSPIIVENPLDGPREHFAWLNPGLGRISSK